MKIIHLIFFLTIGFYVQPAKAADSIIGPRPTTQSVGSFTVSWDNGTLLIKSGNRVVWDSVTNQSFIRSGTHALEATESRGSFNVKENVMSQCTDQTITSLILLNNQLEIKGQVSGKLACTSNYTFTLREAMKGHLQFQLVFGNKNVNYSELAYASSREERFHGFGQQFSYLNLKGKVVPVLSQEGGIGRGDVPITQLVNIALKGSSGGSPLSTYYAVPQYITNTNKSLFLEDYSYAVFDLSHLSKVRVRVFNKQTTGRILAGESILDLITRFTDYAGRMRALPSWFNEGAIVGMQGGTDAVNTVLTELENRGTPVAGVWLQDWVGKRKTSVGSQLWWNWVLDTERYPRWNELVSRVAKRNGRMLCYINPMLVDVPDTTEDLYNEAAKEGHFVKKQDDSIYEIKNTDFSAALIDLTKPEAITWIKGVIKSEMIDKAQCSGWMHDFAEALPFDAKLYSGQSAALYHNQYPLDWARIAREVIEEAKRGEDIVFFNRSGFTGTPAYSTLIWHGDQLPTWEGNDGLQSALLATITSGFSGVSLSHSDIGGYTNINLGKAGWYRREDLLLRWMELSAFTSAFRTHEGLKPESNVQFYSNDRTYSQFDKFARVYKSLAFYRVELMKEANSMGWPLVRHPMMHYPSDNTLAQLSDQFLLGSEILVAPVVDKLSSKLGWRKVYFPDAANTTWVHAFTGHRYGKNSDAPIAPSQLRLSNPAKGNWQWVPAPMGTPPAFYKLGSETGKKWRANLLADGVIKK